MLNIFVLALKLNVKFIDRSGTSIPPCSNDGGVVRLSRSRQGLAKRMLNGRKGTPGRSTINKHFGRARPLPRSSR